MPWHHQILRVRYGLPLTQVDRGGMGSLASRLHMSPELLQELLDLFYNRSPNEKGGDKYERPALKKELMLAYVLVLAQVRAFG